MTTQIDENTDRATLEVCILDHDDLYDSFDEEKLLNSEYTTEKLRERVIAWILEGDECADA